MSLPTIAHDRTVPINEVTLCTAMLWSMLPYTQEDTVKGISGAPFSNVWVLTTNADTPPRHLCLVMLQAGASLLVHPCLFDQIRIKPSFLTEILVNIAKKFYFSILGILVILFFFVHLCCWSPWLFLLCWAHSFEESFLATHSQWMAVLWLLVCW